MVIRDPGKFHKFLFKWESDQVALVTDQEAFLPNSQSYAELNESLIFWVLFSQLLYLKKPKLEK